MIEQLLACEYLELFADGTSIDTFRTHDRDFADAVAEELIVLSGHSLEYFHGNLSAYELEHRKHIKWLIRMKESQDKARSHIEDTIAGNI